MNRYFQLSLLLSVVALSAPVCPASADQLKLPEEIGRIEGPRDTNIFQVEPTVINERYYNSGADERHQNIGTTLPEGSPIPDTDYPVPVVPVTAPSPTVVPTPKPMAPVPSTAPSPTVVPAPKPISTVPPMITPVSGKQNKGHYNSGAAERHQFIGNTLPPGAEIPDTDWPVSVVPSSTLNNAPTVKPVVAPVVTPSFAPNIVPSPAPSALTPTVAPIVVPSPKSGASAR